MKMKKYKLPTLNPHYEYLLRILIHENGNPERFGNGQIKRIRPVYNRIINNPVGKIILERDGVFFLAEFASHIAKGEIIYSSDTLLWYLFDRYGDRHEINFKFVAENENCIRWHYEEIICWMRGLSCKYPQLIHFWSTHGTSVLMFEKEYRR